MKLSFIILGCFCVVAAGNASDGLEQGNPLIVAHEELGRTPEGAAHLWFNAVYLYLDDDSREEGREALTYLTIPFKDRPDWERSSSHRIFVDRLTDPQHAHIFRSYARGTSPDNGYSMEVSEFELDVVASAEDSYGRGWRLVVRSSGADSPRPLYLKKSTKTGLWYVNEFANVYVGIRPPVDHDREAFE